MADDFIAHRINWPYVINHTIIKINRQAFALG